MAESNGVLLLRHFSIYGAEMRAGVLFLAGLFVGACARPVPPVAPSLSAQAYVDDAVDQTVALLTTDEEDHTRAYCSGVWVSESSILTAFHCVEDEQGPVTYAVRSDVFAPHSLAERQPVGGHIAGVYAADAEHDLALLRAVNAPTHKVAKLALELYQGERVHTMGHPKGLWWSYSSGDLAAVRQEPGSSMVWVQATAPISPGNSGGGLFNEQGFLVGICSQVIGGRWSQALNLFVHPQFAHALLTKQGPLL